MNAPQMHPRGSRRDGLPFALETALERRIAADPEWRAGVEWGMTRRGHPEGAVKFHIAEVLANVDRYAVDPEQRRRLRLLALVHDTFKHRVDRDQPRVGENYHGAIAAHFVARYIDDEELLAVCRRHDTAYFTYLVATRHSNPGRAAGLVRALIAELGAALDLYCVFFACDNATGDKGIESYQWFMGQLGQVRAEHAS